MTICIFLAVEFFMLYLVTDEMDVFIGWWRQSRGPQSWCWACGLKYYKAFDSWFSSRWYDWNVRSKHCESKKFLRCHNNSTRSKSDPFICFCPWVWSSGAGELTFSVVKCWVIGCLNAKVKGFKNGGPSWGWKYCMNFRLLCNIVVRTMIDWAY